MNDKIRINILSNKSAVYQAANRLPISAAVAILFGGDRLACIDWAAWASYEGELVGLATVAEEGEMGSGKPTVIGVMVVRRFRRMGIGKALLEAVIEEARRLNLLPLLVDGITPSGLALARSGGWGPEVLTIRDMSIGIELD